jgi:hypothetical protein
MPNGIPMETLARASASNGSKPAGRVESLLAAVILTALTAVLVVIAFYDVFRTFQNYDDEGYILITLKQFLQGHVLYDDLFTQYGPFFYWLHWALFRPGWFGITHDAAGVIATVFWTLCSFLSGWCVWRLTRSLAAAALTQAATFTGLYMLSYEPCHPQGLALLLVSLMLLTATFGSLRPALVAGLLGLFVGLTILTKVNVGIYALVALAVSITAVLPGRAAAGLCVLSGVVALVLPVALMRAHLSLISCRTYAVVVMLSTLIVVLLTWEGDRALRRTFGHEPPSAVTDVPRGFLCRRDAGASVAGLLLALVVISGLTLASGTSLAGLFDGVFWQHRNFPTIYFKPWPLEQGFTAAFVSLAAYLLLQSFRTGQGEALWLLIVVAAMKLTFAGYVFYQANSRGYAELITQALPFTWLAAIHFGTLDPRRQWGRLLIASVTVTQALVAYPVAGTQRALATVFLNVVAGICLADSLAFASRWLQLRLRQPLPQLLGHGLVGLVLVGYFALTARLIQRGYEVSLPLDLRGAHWLRTNEANVAAYRWLCANLERQPGTFLTMPGLNSLYLWTNKEPPSTSNMTHWMTMFDAARQEPILRLAAKDPHLCAVRQNELAARWLRPGQDISSGPLVGFIDQGFTTAAAFSGYEFRVRQPGPLPELTMCLKPGLPPLTPDLPVMPMAHWDPVLELPALQGGQLARLAIVSLPEGTILADSQDNPLVPKIETLIISGDGSAQARLPRNLKAAPWPLDKPLALALTVAQPERLPRNRVLVVRLYDPEGRIITVVPVLQ